MTMADDNESDKSAVSSLEGSVSERIMDHCTALLNHLNNAPVHEILARNAVAKTVLRV